MPPCWLETRRASRCFSTGSWTKLFHLGWHLFGTQVWQPLLQPPSQCPVASTSPAWCKQGSNTLLGGLPSHPGDTAIGLTPEARLENWHTEWTFPMAKEVGAEVALWALANVALTLIAELFPKGDRAEGNPPTNCRCPMAMGASCAFGDIAECLWSDDGKAMLPLLVPAQFLSTPPQMLWHLKILIAWRFQLRNSGFQPFEGWFLQQLAIRSVSMSLTAYEFHSEQHECH